MAVITIGTPVEAVKELRHAINDILHAKVDQSTMVAALDALSKGVQPVGTITHCTFNSTQETT